MRHVAVIAGRELRSVFVTPTAYVALTVYSVLGGVLFFLTLGNFYSRVQQLQATGAFQALEYLNLNEAVISPCLTTFGVVLLLLLPILTMRTFAEERSQGTLELLLTSPLSATELVVGKYLAVLVLLAVLTAITAVYPAILFLYGDPEPLQTLSGLVTFFLYGASLAAMGCFISAMTASQILAALVTFVSGLLLLLVDEVAVLGVSPWISAVARYLGSESHFANGVTGRVYIEDLVYFASFIFLFLFLARHAVEWMRWR